MAIFRQHVEFFMKRDLNGRGHYGKNQKLFASIVREERAM